MNNDLKNQNKQRQNRNKREKIRNNRKKKENNRLNIFLGVSFILLTILLATYFRQKKLISDLQAESNRLIQEQEETNQKIDELIKEIKESNSLEYIEKRAREELGMIKEDEKIYVNPENLETEEGQEYIQE